LSVKQAMYLDVNPQDSIFPMQLHLPHVVKSTLNMPNKSV